MQDYLSTVLFYNEYSGHHPQDLFTVKNKLDNINKNYYNNNKKYIYLAGDSTLDNKYWVLNQEAQQAVNGYEYILMPPLMTPDISYHMNKLLVNNDYYVINTAIEASTLLDRSALLLPQDNFIKNNITKNDILIVSIGCNDIALKPSYTTMLNMAKLIFLNNTDNIKQGPDVAWGLKYFIDMFKNNIEYYILRLIENHRPKKIIICMYYYPDEQISNSWSDKVLYYLGYNTNPKKLQEVIKQIFIHAISKIDIDDCTEIIPFAMYSVLNGKNTKDYVQRLEPSNQGGQKLAKELVNLIIINNILT